MSDIGVKLGVEGEAQFKKALGEINTNLKTLGTEMKAVTSVFDKNDTSVENLTGQNQVLNKQIDEQKNKLDLLKGKLAESAAEYGENDAKTQKWQQAVNLATADLNKMERQLGDNNKELDEAAEASGQAGDGVEKAGQQADQSGDDAEKGSGKWAKLKDGLLKVGEIAGKAILALGAAAAAAGSALVAMSVSGAAYADDIMTVSTQTGIATDKLQEYKYAAELVDVSTETLTKSMAKNIKSMKGVQDGTKLSVEAYDRLGVSVLNSDGSLRDGQAVYWETIDALGQVQNETERDALAMQILGKSAQELNPLIEAGSERMLELAAKAQAAGYVLSGDTLEAFGAFDDQLQLLKVNSEGAKNALGTVLLPMLTELATDGNDLITQFTSGIAGANGDIGKMGEVIGETLSGLVNKIVEKLPQIIEAGMGIISALGQGLMDNLPEIISSAVEIITTLAGGLVDALPKIVEAALQIILTLALGVADALPELIPAIVETVMMIVETLIDNVDMLIDAAIAIIMALAEGLIESLPKLIEKAPEIIAKLVSEIIENAPKLLGAAVELIASLASGLAENFKTILTEVGGWINDNIVQPIKDKVSDFVSAGGDLIAGVWQGISDKATWLWNQVSGFFKTLTSKIKNFFGIASPSKLFADEIGGNLAAGIGVGFADEMKTVAKQMNNSIPTDFDIGGNFSAGLSYAGAAGQGSNHGVSQIVNIYSPTPLSPSQIARESKNAMRRLAWA